MRRFTYRRSLSLHPVTISGDRVPHCRDTGGRWSGVDGAVGSQPVRVSPMPDLSTLAVFLHVNS